MQQFLQSVKASFLGAKEFSTVTSVLAAHLVAPRRPHFFYAVKSKYENFITELTQGLPLFLPKHWPTKTFRD